MSLFQKQFVNIAGNWNELLQFRVNVTKSVPVLAKIEISGPKLLRGYEWQTLGKFLPVEDGHKRKYM